ncbi:putative Histidine kinase [Verrucomicrobia bacterium]|nr:putative Histidine kinase [Verrucomicrobiota bacterium]
MKLPLQILHLEDDPVDAELVREMLEAEGLACSVQCVRNRAEYEAALAEGGFDLILTDYSLPRFDGLTALAMARQKQPDKPTIFVSGTMGEEAAVKCLQQGATDYVLKDRLFRLPSAVRRAAAEAEQLAVRRKLEAQLLRAQRLETIGALAGGIAHDLNNVLAPILIGTQLLAEELKSETSRKVLETIRSRALRGSEMVQQILAFARGVGGEPVVLEIAHLLTEIEKLVRETFPRSICIEVKAAEGLSPVVGNTTQLHQVLLNLCVNARDAMPQGGTLCLAAQDVLLDKWSTRLQPEPVSGCYVMLTVSDTGHGIAPELLDRIFEPFFTTKELGKGTGLGLSTVLGIVKSHGGFLDVASQVGHGSSFKVYLPARASAQKTAKPVRNGVADPATVA